MCCQNKREALIDRIAYVEFLVDIESKSAVALPDDLTLRSMQTSKVLSEKSNKF